MDNYKICECCGKKFKSAKGNFKYCSDKCRNKAKKLVREKWQKETNYNESEKNKRRESRKAQSKKKEEELKKKILKAKEEHKKQKEETNKESLKELKEKAETSFFYKAQLCMANGDMRGYYENLQKFYINESVRCNEIPKPNKNFVGSVDILSPSFVDEMMKIHKYEETEKDELL